MEEKTINLAELITSLDSTGFKIFDEEEVEPDKAFATLLSLDDEHFEVLAPGILQSFQQTLNNVGDKLVLAQSMNAMGLRPDDLLYNFNQFSEELENLPISVVKRDFLKTIFATFLNCINDTEGVSKRMVPVAIEVCNDKAKIPTYAHLTDSGMDVYALEDITIHPGETKLISTGIKVALPVGFELQARPKSGRTLKTKLRIANTPGTIDQGYRDEIKIIIDNIEPRIKDITIDDNGKVTSILYGSDFTIGADEKFCQLVLSEVPKAVFFKVNSVSEIGEDRGGGFGSTGLK